MELSTVAGKWISSPFVPWSIIKMEIAFRLGNSRNVSALNFNVLLETGFCKWIYHLTRKLRN